MICFSKRDRNYNGIAHSVYWQQVESKAGSPLRCSDVYMSYMQRELNGAFKSFE